MEIKKVRFTKIIGILVFTCILWGCVTPGLYSVNMYYDAEKAIIPEYVKADETAATISVAEFVDTRQMDDQLVIGRVVESDGTKTLIVPRNVKAAKSIANGIKKYLKKAGYKVDERTESWDLREESIPRGDSKVLIGGSIEELEITCRKDFPFISYKSTIKLNIILADMSRGKILYKTGVGNRYEQDHVLFSENILSDQADMILADAIEKLFEDKAMMQTLKKALSH
jgi:ABC-type transport system substrate-binding protein